MYTQKYDLTMREFKNRYCESDLPTLVHTRKHSHYALASGAPFRVSAR